MGVQVLVTSQVRLLGAAATRLSSTGLQAHPCLTHRQRRRRRPRMLQVPECLVSQRRRCAGRLGTAVGDRSGEVGNQEHQQVPIIGHLGPGDAAAVLAPPASRSEPGTRRISTSGDRSAAMHPTKEGSWRYCHGCLSHAYRRGRSCAAALARAHRDAAAPFIGPRRLLHRPGSSVSGFRISHKTARALGVGPGGSASGPVAGRYGTVRWGWR
jgi:hypothetical protein